MLRPPFGTQTVEKMIQRMERWCQDGDSSAERKQMLQALVTPRGRFVLYAALEGCDDASATVTVLLPLARLLLTENFLKDLKRSGLTDHNMLLFQHALEAAERLRSLRQYLDQHLHGAAASPDRLHDVLPLLEVTVMVLSGGTERGALATNGGEVEAWRNTLHEIRNLPIQSDRLLCQLDDLYDELQHRAEVLQNGGFDRHDNDRADYRDIQLLPTRDELLCTREAYLPRMDTPGLLFEPPDAQDEKEDTFRRCASEPGLAGPLLPPAAA